MAKNFGIAHEVLRGGDEIRARFPQFPNYHKQRCWALFEPGAGTILAKNCLTALKVCYQFVIIGKFNPSNQRIQCEFQSNQL